MKATKTILLIFLLSACTKGGGNIYVEGRVYNPITGEGIEGVEIDLLRNKIGGAAAAQSGGVKVCELVYTDAEGHFEIKHTGGIIHGYYVQALLNADDYYGIGWINVSTKKKDYPPGGGTFDVKLSKNMHADFRAVPYGYLKLSIHNVNCQGAGDTMVLERYYNTTISSNYGFYPVGFYGCYDNSAPPPVKIPAGNWELAWTVIRSGVTTHGSTTIQVAGGQTTEYSLEY